jgi:hypothetical protein
VAVTEGTDGAVGAGAPDAVGAGVRRTMTVDSGVTAVPTVLLILPARASAPTKPRVTLALRPAAMMRAPMAAWRRRRLRPGAAFARPGLEVARRRSASSRAAVGSLSGDVPSSVPTSVIVLGALVLGAIVGLGPVVVAVVVVVIVLVGAGP